MKTALERSPGTLVGFDRWQQEQEKHPLPGVEAAALVRRLERAGLIELVFRHAESSYPQECCGFIMEDEAGSVRYLPTTNLATSSRGSGAWSNSPGGRHRFAADLVPLLRALIMGDRLTIIAHSHPERNARPSLPDREGFLWRSHSSDPARPWFPGCAYLVVSPAWGRDYAPEARLYLFDLDSERFEQIARFDRRGRTADDLSRGCEPSG